MLGRKYTKLTRRQKERYIELFKEGKTIQQAIKQVQSEFSLQKSHSFGNIYNTLKSDGVQFKRGARPKKPQLDIEYIIQVFSDSLRQASRIPQLETELVRYKTSYQNCLRTIDELSRAKQEKKEESFQYRLALIKGEVKPPLN
jgi:hypothetical protein